MAGTYKPIGELVVRVDERNTKGMDNLLGVSINKCFIPSVANTIGTDLSNYKVIKKNDFAVSLMQVSRDSKIPIACFKDNNEAIMSPAYSIFRVQNENEVLPDYLDMWFKRPEFDRECSFIAVGGVRGSMPWEEFARIKVLVPDMNEQKKFVRNYKVIADRIALKQKINDNLDKSIYTLFQYRFQNNKDRILSGDSLDGWNISPLSELAEFKYGKMAPPEIITESGYPIYSGYRVVGYCNQYMFELPTLVVLARGVSGTGEVRISPPYCHLTNLSIAVLLNDRTYIHYLLYYLENDNLISLDSGSAQSQITINDLASHKVVIPPYEMLKKFDDDVIPLLKIMDANNREIELLNQSEKMLLSRLSRH